MNGNLFIPIELHPTLQDVADLQACNRAAYSWAWRKLTYALKDCLLSLFAESDGYDLQQWDDFVDIDGFTTGESRDGAWLASHKHILSRHLLGDAIFHRPTNEFSYYNDRLEVTKQSADYEVLKAQVKETLRGRKLHPYSRQAQREAWPALKRLVKKYGNFLRHKGSQRGAREIATALKAAEARVGELEAERPAPAFLSFVCAECGGIGKAALFSIHDGTTLTHAECGGDTIIGTFRTPGRESILENAELKAHLRSVEERLKVQGYNILDLLAAVETHKAERDTLRTKLVSVTEVLQYCASRKSWNEHSRYDEWEKLIDRTEEDRSFVEWLAIAALEEQ